MFPQVDEVAAEAEGFYLSHVFAEAAPAKTPFAYISNMRDSAGGHYICRLMQMVSWLADTAPSAGRLASRLHGSVAEGAQVAAVCLTRVARSPAGAARPAPHRGHGVDGQARLNGVDNFIGV